jgi:hypothetical protein
MSCLTRLHGKAREVYEWHCLAAWSDTGVSDWSQRRVASRLGINIRSVQRAEADLLADGWLLYTATDEKGAGIRQAGLKVNDPFPERLKSPDGTGRRTRRTYDMGTDGAPAGYTAHVDRKDGACVPGHTAHTPTLPEPLPKLINHTQTPAREALAPSIESVGEISGSERAALIRERDHKGTTAGRRENINQLLTWGRSVQSEIDESDIPF